MKRIGWLLVLTACGAPTTSLVDAGRLGDTACDAGLVGAFVDARDSVAAVGRTAELVIAVTEPPCRQTQRIVVEVVGPDNRPFAAESSFDRSFGRAEARVRLTPVDPGLYTVVVTFEPSVGRGTAAVHVGVDRTTELPVFSHPGLCSAYEVTAAGALLCANEGFTEYVVGGETRHRFQTSTVRASSTAEGAVWVVENAQLHRFEEDDGGLRETRLMPLPGDVALSATRESVMVWAVDGAMSLVGESADGGLSSRSLFAPELTRFGTGPTDVLMRWNGRCGFVAGRGSSFRVAQADAGVSQVALLPPVALGRHVGWFPTPTMPQSVFVVGCETPAGDTVPLPQGWSTLFGVPSFADPVLMASDGNTRVLLDTRADTPRFELWEHGGWKLVAVLDEYVVLSDGVSARVMRR